MSQNSILIIAIALLSSALIGSFLAITLLYQGDIGVALAGLTALGVMAFAQLAGLKVSADNNAGIKAVKATADDLTVAVDGRMTLLIETMKEFATAQQRLASAQGLAHGITIGRGQVGADPVDSVPPIVDVPPAPGDHQ